MGDIKKRLGCKNSPPAKGEYPKGEGVIIADAYVNGLYALQFVEGQLIAGRSEKPEQYFNLRSEIWCRAAELFADGDVELKNIDHKLKG